jgi:hypothetical protein
MLLYLSVDVTKRGRKTHLSMNSSLFVLECFEASRLGDG